MLATTMPGCFGGDGKKSDDSSSATPSPSNNTTAPPTLDVTVAILNVTAEPRENETINVTWEVSFDVADPNVTLTIDHTDVHFGNESASEPVTNSSYGNATESDAGPPGVYNATIAGQPEGVLYLRAHAIINGTDYWSDEMQVDVLAPFPVHEIVIGGSLGGPLASYDPGSLTIQQGEGVAWTNDDQVGSPHSATSDAAAPQQFDTGELGVGVTSEIVYFDVPGTYTYHCSVHPQTMEGTIVVEPQG